MQSKQILVISVLFYTNGITSHLIPLVGKLLHSRIAAALRTVMSCTVNCSWPTPSQVMQKLEAVEFYCR